MKHINGIELTTFKLAQVDMSTIEIAMNRWRECLGSPRDAATESPHPNSLLEQMQHLTLDYIGYQVVRKSYNILLRHKSPEPVYKPLVHVLLDNCIYDSILIRFRRMIDLSKHSTLYGSRGVHALGPLIKDIKERVNEISPVQYMAANGVTCTYEESIQQEREQERRTKFTGKPIEFDFDPPNTVDPQTIKNITSTYEWLFDSRNAPGSAVQTRPMLLLDAAYKDLNSARQILNHANKRLAHSDSAESLDNLETMTTVQYRDVDSAYHTLRRVYWLLHQFVQPFDFDWHIVNLERNLWRVDNFCFTESSIPELKRYYEDELLPELRQSEKQYWDDSVARLTVPSC